MKGVPGPSRAPGPSMNRRPGPTRTHRAARCGCRQGPLLVSGNSSPRGLHRRRKSQPALLLLGTTDDGPPGRGRRVCPEPWAKGDLYCILPRPPFARPAFCEGLADALSRGRPPRGCSWLCGLRAVRRRPALCSWVQWHEVRRFVIAGVLFGTSSYFLRITSVFYHADFESGRHSPCGELPLKQVSDGAARRNLSRTKEPFSSSFFFLFSPFCFFPHTP